MLNHENSFNSTESDVVENKERENSGYNFVQLDPRKTIKENPDYDFGIEITVPKLVKEGMLNLDHHGPDTDSKTPAACDQSLDCLLPDSGAIGATIRLDKDSLAAMAILQLRKYGREKDINIDLVETVSKLDRLGPIVEKDVSSQQDLATALDIIASQQETSLSEKISLAMQILTGEFDQSTIKDMVDARDKELEEAKEEAKIEVVVPGKLVYVESKNRFATQLGYKVATTVIACNPEMPVLARQDNGLIKPTGETYRKYTICRYDDHVSVDLPSALAEIQQLEEGWGGRENIFGSPQNQDSRLSPDQIIKIIRKHIS